MPQSEWLKDWVLEFLANPLTQRPVGYSNRTLERRILSETSLTLGQWCQQARALVALRELSQGSSVLEAAIAAGFETSSGFIQSFRKQFGDTPARMARLLRSTSD
jgi:AraC-like DNA-binding protein